MMFTRAVKSFKRFSFVSPQPQYRRSLRCCGDKPSRPPAEPLGNDSMAPRTSSAEAVRAGWTADSPRTSPSVQTRVARSQVATVGQPRIRTKSNRGLFTQLIALRAFWEPFTICPGSPDCPCSSEPRYQGRLRRPTSQSATIPPLPVDPPLVKAHTPKTHEEKPENKPTEAKANESPPSPSTTSTSSSSSSSSTTETETEKHKELPDEAKHSEKRKESSDEAKHSQVSFTEKRSESVTSKSSKSKESVLSKSSDSSKSSKSQSSLDKTKKVSPAQK
ncbi:putative protein TPRXL [Leguminivora glycinivorella]|uniref:putative protein TPRXL n=1 Tax=Leguminivora glycinivorella TaxID=1035111 RepID=UPI00200BC3A0|nr:putative protein TPRXL [Leguminivora glycinivorella]